MVGTERQPIREPEASSPRARPVLGIAPLLVNPMNGTTAGRVQLAHEALVHESVDGVDDEKRADRKFHHVAVDDAVAVAARRSSEANQ